MNSFLPSQIPGFKDSLFLAVQRWHLFMLLFVGQKSIPLLLWLLESAGGTDTLRAYQHAPAHSNPQGPSHLQDVSPFVGGATGATLGMVKAREAHAQTSHSCLFKA